MSGGKRSYSQLAEQSKTPGWFGCQRMPESIVKYLQCKRESVSHDVGDQELGCCSER